MTTGTWILAGLLLAAGALPADVYPMNSSKLQIPINLDPTRRAEIRELLLFVSTDQGKSWKQQASVQPGESAFSYYAAADGEYWFTVCVVNQQGKQEPEDVYKATAIQKVLVDTQKPDLHITSAERVGDEVVVKWEARDDNLDPGSLKLEYRTPETPAGVWNLVALPSPAGGQGSFRPGSPGAVQLRLQVKDVAENAATATAEVPAAAGAAVAQANPAPAPPPVPSATVMAGPPAPGGQPADAGGWGGASHVAVPASFSRVDQPPAFTNPNLGAVPVVTNPNPAGQVVASSQSSPAAAGPAPTAAALPDTAAPHLPTPAPPPLQIVKDHQITLQYTVNGCGPSGLGSVELYVTQDDGQNWALSPGGGPPINSTPQTDAKGNPVPLQLSLPVTLPEEGVYGFYIVVKNKAGYGMKPPQKGTPPRLRVELDTTQPVVDLYNPVPKPGLHNALVLRWNVKDRNLAPKPISLYWSDRANGDWKVIAQDQPAANDVSGQYVWQLPADGTLPPRVYLKITAQDLAGNVATAITSEPQLIDVSEPVVDSVQLGVAPAH